VNNERNAPDQLNNKDENSNRQSNFANESSSSIQSHLQQTIDLFQTAEVLEKSFYNKAKKVMKSNSEGSEISVIQKLQAHLVIQKLLVEESLLHCLH
jgi:hypothetical protein